MKFIYLCIIFCCNSLALKAQAVAINTDGSAANTSAILDIKSTAKGILVPRLTKLEKNSIATPATGLLIFQNAPDSVGFQYYDGSKWLWLAASNSIDTIAWKMGGNTGTNSTTNFIGTKDNVPLSFRQNNKWIGRLDATNKNYFIGAASGANSTINNTIAIGDSVGYNTKAANSILIGDHAGYNIKNINTGNNSVIIGYYAGDSSVANASTVVGSLAGRKNISAESAFFGSSAGENNTIGVNCFIGANSGQYNTTGTYNTFMGNGAGNNNNANNNTAIGTSALISNTINNNNTAIGSFALKQNSGKANTAVGAFALTTLQSTNSQWNVAVGDSAAYELAFGANNVVMGSWAFKEHVRGNRNTAIGNYALGASINGDENTALGENSLTNTNSNLNTGIGKNAGATNINGTNNTLLGSFADVGSSALTNATAIGFRSNVTQSNALILGAILGVNGATANTNVGIGTTAPTTTLEVRGGIKTMYSGSVIITCGAGLNIYNLPISPAVPTGWDFTNTMVIVSVVDGTTGTIYQTKLISTNFIQIDMNNNFPGATRFNYIIFKL